MTKALLNMTVSNAASLGCLGLPFTICAPLCAFSFCGKQIEFAQASLQSSLTPRPMPVSKGILLKVITKTGIDFLRGPVPNAIYFKPMVFIVISFENHVRIPVTIDIDQVQQ